VEAQPLSVVPVTIRKDAGLLAQADRVPALRRMVGRTPAMQALASAVLKVGKSDATVLVHGESGTGKELVAEAIHEASARRAGPIVKVNCAALVETLLLSELFGHEKGAFTGAAARRRGRFEVADGGTLFLDEIGDISPRTQVALLRVLQDKTFERVGGVTAIRADVRIVCATHRDLGTMVSRGEFREDLYYRLRGVVLEVPALRQRVADLPLVAAAILDRIARERGAAAKSISASALEGLAQHTWPGNIRELENALRAAALFADGETIELEDFTANVDGLAGLSTLGAPPPGSGLQTVNSRRPTPPSDAPSPPETLANPRISGDFASPDSGTDAAFDGSAMSQPSKIAQVASGEAGRTTEVAYAAIRAGVSLSELKRDIERDCIARALAETGGNITRAASLLGMKRPRLSQLVKQYGFGSTPGTGGEADGDVEDEG
jgi:sigma-54 specific flagellar transcriptional regulator A